MAERHPRRGNGPNSRRRQAPVAPEPLEGRQLLTYTPLGFSIPDLAIVDAFTGPVGAYGGPLAVTVDVSNLGQSSMPEPLNQFPGSPSAADAGPSQIAVYLTDRPLGNPNAPHSPPVGERILLGTIDVPAIPQNRLARVTGTVTLPAEPPPGFPVLGQNAFISLEIDPNRRIRDLDRTNNVLQPATSFLLVPNLPDLEAIALGLPPVLNPGDTVVPQVKVANYGAAPTDRQAPVVVQVVASLDRTFGPGDIVLGTFVVENIPALSEAPTKRFIPGDVNLIDPVNVVTLDAAQAVTLPATGAPYFVGVIVDPLDEITEISELGIGTDPTLRPVQIVADSGLGLPPAGVIGEVPGTPRPFPFPPFETPTGTPTPVAVAPPTTTPPGEMTVGAAGRRSIATRPALALQNRPLVDASQPARARAEAIAARLAARRALRGL